MKKSKSVIIPSKQLAKDCLYEALSEEQKEQLDKWIEYKDMPHRKDGIIIQIELIPTVTNRQLM